MMWPGVEPQRGQYNMTYINVMKQLIETLQRYDIFVLLDCHQDLLSPKFCGEGVPDFAAIVGTFSFFGNFELNFFFWSLHELKFNSILL
jgi:hypothetical protein